jgi:hypothetical protein
MVWKCSFFAVLKLLTRWIKILSISGYCKKAHNMLNNSKWLMQEVLTHQWDSHLRMHVLYVVFTFSSSCELSKVGIKWLDLQAGLCLSMMLVCVLQWRRQIVAKQCTCITSLSQWTACCTASIFRNLQILYFVPELLALPIHAAALQMHCLI